MTQWSCNAELCCMVFRDSEARVGLSRSSLEVSKMCHWTLRVANFDELLRSWHWLIWISGHVATASSRSTHAALIVLYIRTILCTPCTRPSGRQYKKSHHGIPDLRSWSLLSQDHCQQGKIREG